MASISPSVTCGHCHKQAPKMSKCGRCELIHYCNQECQKAAWKTHKAVCQPRLRNPIQIASGDEKKRVTAYAWPSELVRQTGAGPTGVAGKKVSQASAALLQTDQTISLTSEKDVVSFASTFSPEKIATLKRYQGIQEDKLSALLEKQDYVSILKHVWTEKDLNKAIAWLKPRAEQGHVILMFELARTLGRLANAKKEFTSDSLKEIFFWFFRGLHCTRLDIACNTDPSTSAAIEMLRFTYGQFDFPAAMIEALDQKTIMKEGVESWAPSENHPSPQWVIFHGMGMMMGEVRLKPAENWLSLRQAFHEKQLEQIARLTSG